MVERDTCKGCSHWNDLKNGNGECRKHPPVVIGNSEYEGGFFTTWPITLKTEWCGEGKWRTNWNSIFNVHKRKNEV